MHPSAGKQAFNSYGIGIAIGVDIETDSDCDADTDPDNAVRAASRDSHNQPSGSAGGPMTPIHRYSE